jgi:RNA polymerase sigma factor (sigma-70 family)
VPEQRSLDHLDAALVERAVAGNAGALDDIVTSLTKPFYNLALRMLHGHHDAEDATQEALLRVATNLSSFRGESRFSTWAWTVATRSILDYQDGRARAARVDPVEFADDLGDGMDSSPSDDPEAVAQLGAVKLGCGRAMLQTLNGDMRIAYTLGEILELDPPEAAQALGVSQSAYRKRLSRARSQLNDVLRASCGVVDADNDCRCSKRRKPAIALGRLEPADAVPIDIAGVTKMVRGMDDLGRVAAYFRADPMANASEQLLPAVRRILSIT